MKVNDVIRITGGDRYSLIKSIVYENEKYFLAVKLKENNDFDLNSLLIFKECSDIEGTYVKIVYDERIIKILNKIFSEN